MVDLGASANDDRDAHEVSRQLRGCVVHYRRLENRVLLLSTPQFVPRFGEFVFAVL